MARSYTLSIPAHDSIYTNKLTASIGYNRKVNIYYSLPDKKTNKETGILIFIAGFGGNANSNVYKQMRQEFADAYNLVTIQCDYFGYEFMQSNSALMFSKNHLYSYLEEEELNLFFQNSQFSIEKLTNYSKRALDISAIADLSKENSSYFNDMGFMQAIDNINAILYVLNHLYENELLFNSKKIIAFGPSHGAYLAYLCNALSPKLFSLIIDNSAWVYPQYLKHPRMFFFNIGIHQIIQEYSYYATKMSNNPSFKVISDRNILDLNYLYNNFKNECKIISYHGIDDTLITAKDKRSFCSNIINCTYNEITTTNDIFKSCTHGLDADFKKLFASVIDNLNFTFDKSEELDFVEEVLFKTDKAQYMIDYKNIFPKINIL